MIKSKIIRIFGKAVISICFSISVMNYLDLTLYNMLFYFVAIATFIWLHYYLKNYCIKNTSIYTYLFSLIYTISLFVGKMINNEGSIHSIISSPQATLLFLFNIVSFAGVLSSVVNVLFNITSIKNKRIIIYRKKYFCLTWLVIFILWLPCYVSYYPGILSYDIYNQTPQALGVIAYTQHHPPLHTFFWQICISIGINININPLVIYSVAQMLILSYSFSAMIKLLFQHKTDVRVILLSVIFVALNPIFALFSFIPTKDVLSGAFLILAIIRGIQLKYGKRSTELLFVIDVLLSCLLRHNVFYAFLLTLILLVVIGLIKYKRTISLLCISLVICVLVNGPLFKYLEIEKNNIQESLSIPLQQISTSVVRHINEFSSSDKEEINEFINTDDIMLHYNPRFADPIKGRLDVDAYRKNKKDFWKLWIKMFCNHPTDFIDAFLTQNIGFWYQDADIPDKIYGAKYIETHSMIYPILDFDFERENLLPSVNLFYEKFSNYDIQPSISFIPDIFSLSLPFWLVLFSFFKCLLKKQKMWIALVPLLFLWLTLMGGPISNMRYILPLVMSYPLLFAIVFE